MEPNSQIIVRHISGAKVNKIDQFRLDSTEEISFGRDVSSTVSYDSPKDDVVSRKHAVIRIKTGNPPSFLLEDLRSSNGTFLNGNKLTGQVELYPEDTIEFGRGGPKFVFDIQPRPPGMGARTRIMSKFETSDTQRVTTDTVRVAPQPDFPTVPITPASAPPISQTAAPAKVGVGKNTVQMMLKEERKRTSQTWVGALIAIVAFAGGGGGWLYWNNRVQTLAVKQESEAVNRQTQSQISQQMGMSPGDIVNTYGSAVVAIRVAWRLFDADTGQAVYLKRYRSCSSGLERPAYLQTSDGKVPVLTTDPNAGYEVKDSLYGSGFVANSQGFILTNKHVAAGWSEIEPLDYVKDANGRKIDVGGKAWLITNEQSIERSIKRGECFKGDGIFDISSEKWRPGEDSAVLIQHTKSTAVSKNAGLFYSPSKNFFGKNEDLTVTFARSDQQINGTLLRVSPGSDVALIKVDTPQSLQTTPISADDEIKVGERIVVIGYPGMSRDTVQIDKSEIGHQRAVIYEVPTVSNGLVAKTYTPSTNQGAKEIVNIDENMIAMTGVTTGSGNSGGPVFDSKGKVIGLFTAARNDVSGGRMTFAVPIKAGRELLSAQRPL